MLKKILLLALLFPFTSMGADKPVVIKADPAHTIKIIDEINMDILGQASTLSNMVEDMDGKGTIDILFNSPGGIVFFGEMFAQSMRSAKARGINIRCTVISLAASMAFNLLTECSERYALPGARLLFHPVRAGAQGGLRAIDAAQMAIELQKIDEALLAKLLANTGMEKGLLTKSYYDERLWTAEELILAVKPGWLKLVDSVSGVKDMFDIVDTKRQRGPFGHSGKDSELLRRLYNL